MGGSAGTTTVVACDPMMPFDTPYFVYGLNRDSGTEQTIHPTPDELTVYVAVGVPWYQAHMFVAKRASTSEPFGQLMPLTALAGTTFELSASLTDDGLNLFIDSRRPVWEAGTRVFLSTRNSVDADFLSLNELILDGDPGVDQFDPYVLPDGSAIYFMSSGNGNELRRATLHGATAEPSVALPMAMAVRFPVVSADELTLFFAAGPDGNSDIFVTRRASRDVAFGSPSYINELNTSDTEMPQWISPDGCRLYFSRMTAAGQTYSYIAERVRK